jgi:hypothetical protein
MQSKKKQEQKEQALNCKYEMKVHEGAVLNRVERMV